MSKRGGGNGFGGRGSRGGGGGGGRGRGGGGGGGIDGASGNEAVKTLENSLVLEMIRKKVMMAASIQRSQRIDPNWASVNEEDVIYNSTGMVLAFPYLKGTALVPSPKGPADVLFNSPVCDPPHWEGDDADDDDCEQNDDDIEEEEEEGNDGNHFGGLEERINGRGGGGGEAFNARHLRKEKMMRKTAQMAIHLLSDVFMGMIQQSHLGTPDIITPSVNNEDVGIFWTKTALKRAASKRVKDKCHKAGGSKTERARTTFHKPLARKILEYKSLSKGDKKELIALWQLTEAQIIFEKYGGEEAYEAETVRLAQEEAAAASGGGGDDDDQPAAAAPTTTRGRGRGGRGRGRGGRGRGRGRGNGGWYGGGGGGDQQDGDEEGDEGKGGSYSFDYSDISETIRQLCSVCDMTGPDALDVKKTQFMFRFMKEHYEKTASIFVDPTERGKVGLLKRECEEKIKIFVRRLRLKKTNAEKKNEENASRAPKDKFAELCKQRCAEKDIGAVYAQQVDGEAADVGYMVYAVIMDPNFSPADALECVFKHCANEAEDGDPEDRSFSKEPHRACHIKDDLLYKALGCTERTSFAPIFCESSALEAEAGKFTKAEWRKAGSVYQDLVPDGDVREKMKEDAADTYDERETILKNRARLNQYAATASGVATSTDDPAEMEQMQRRRYEEERQGRLEGLSRDDISNDVLLGAYESRDPISVFSLRNAHAWADFFGAEVEGDLTSVLYTEAVDSLTKSSSSGSGGSKLTGKDKNRNDSDNDEDPESQEYNQRGQQQQHQHCDPVLQQFINSDAFIVQLYLRLLLLETIEKKKMDPTGTITTREKMEEMPSRRNSECLTKIISFG